LARPSSGDSSNGRDVTAALLERARNGEAQALGDLLEHFRPYLSNLARQLLSPALAQKVGASDLFQETCIDAMRDFGAARVQNVVSLEAWLVSLLSNNLKDWQRKFRASQKRDVRRERSLHDTESKIGLKKITLVSNDPTPPSHIIKKESCDLVKQAMSRLARGYQQIIRWRTEERKSWQEIALQLNRSEAAVRMLWKRAVERLKRELRSRDQ
jgi:RNA polymerase sigma-70 factor (ECF subfamily)